MTVFTALRWIVTSAGLGTLYGLTMMAILGRGPLAVTVTIVGAVAGALMLGRLWLYRGGLLPRFWPTRIRRHCYDKPHRCPGWAGGGRKYARDGQTICPSGSLPADMYERRLWKWRFHRCDECGTVALPIVIKYLDLFWWVKWGVPVWPTGFRMARERLIKMDLIRLGLRLVGLGATTVVVTTTVTLIAGAISWPMALLVIGVQCIIAGLAILLYNRVKRRGAVSVFTGTCDVCDEAISLEYRPSEGLIDIGVDEDKRVYTWIRHIGGPQSGCEIYSSPVWLQETLSKR